jgi:hypothetical protein
MLELHDGDGATIAANNDWQSDQKAAIIESKVPPRNDIEAAIVTTVNPGAYTAIVRGKDGASGVAMVEAYQLSD